MKKFVVFALAVTGFFIWLNRNDSSKPAAPATQGTPSAVSEHDWAKHSIDRARAVTIQARQNTAQSQDP
jgi:hypothetical protein